MIRLWIMNEDGSHPKFVTDLRDKSRFTGCGRFILFGSHRSGISDLVRVDEDGANPKFWRLVQYGARGVRQTENLFYYPEILKPRWKIGRVSIDGGQPVDIVENPVKQCPVAPQSRRITAGLSQRRSLTGTHSQDWCGFERGRPASESIRCCSKQH